MSATMHLVHPDPQRSGKRFSTCGRYVRVLRPGQVRKAADKYVGTERRDLADCRSCLGECLPGSHGGTTDPDSIDLSEIHA